MEPGKTYYRIKPDCEQVVDKFRKFCGFWGKNSFLKREYVKPFKIYANSLYYKELVHTTIQKIRYAYSGMVDFCRLEI